MNKFCSSTVTLQVLSSCSWIISYQYLSTFLVKYVCFICFMAVLFYLLYLLWCMSGYIWIWNSWINVMQLRKKLSRKKKELVCFYSAWWSCFSYCRSCPIFRINKCSERFFFKEKKLWQEDTCQAAQMVFVFSIFCFCLSFVIYCHNWMSPQIIVYCKRQLSSTQETHDTSWETFTTKYFFEN